MPVIITDDCINCSACETECPVNAIFPKLNQPGKRSLFINNLFIAERYQSFDHYYINPGICNECRDAFSSPRCNSVCPVSCCESEDENNTHEYSNVKIKINPVSICKISLN